MKPQIVKYMLMAQDMDRAVTFYRDTLGFEESFISPYWSELSFGDAVLALHGCSDSSRKESGLSIQYEDVESAFSEAIKAGASEVQAPEQRQGEPIKLGVLSDPEGNVIMLTQYIGETQ